MSYDLPDYASMLADPVRGAAYFAALRATVQPGHVVADIGAGPGVLGVYAAVLGARRVFLVEPDESVEAAVALAEENGVAHRIEIIRAQSTSIELPERADVIVSDLRGVLPLFGTHMAAAADMRRRHLAPSGVCIPHRDTMYVALLDDVVAYGNQTRRLDSLPPEIGHASLDRLLVNRWFRVHADADSLLAAPAEWIDVNYDAPPERFDGAVEASITRSGTIHGVICWFDTELAAGVGYSNAPSAPRALYGQAMFPIAAPIAVEEGDDAQIRLRAVRSGDEHLWTWSVRVDRGEQLVGHARHSSLEGLALSPNMLMRRAPDFVPARNHDADCMRLMLEHADGARSTNDIAAALRDTFPVRFPSAREAIDFVVQHDHLWQ